MSAQPAGADDWPQWLGPRRDGVWREKGIIEQFPKDGPKRVWRTALGAGYAGPAVADGKVFVTDRILAQGAKNANNPFAQTAVAGQERVLCLDEKTGEMLWKYAYDCTYEISYPAGPRTTPVVDGDKVYTLGAMGDLLCLRVKDGQLVWKKNLVREYDARVPLWGFAANPLVDGDRLICLVGGSAGVAAAFDKNTGKKLWGTIDGKEIGYAPPMLFEIGGRPQLIIWHPMGIHGLQPESGKTLWFQRFPSRGELKANLSIPTPRQQGNKIFITSFYDGSLLFELDKNGAHPKVVWHKKGRSENPDDAAGFLHSIMVTPFWIDESIYGVSSYGELCCLNAADGEMLWSTRKPITGGPPVRWGNAFLVRHESQFFLFTEKGDLVIAHLSPKGYQEMSRAHVIEPTNSMARDRRVVWTFPAFANRHAYIRNDNEIICVSLAADQQKQ